MNGHTPKCNLFKAVNDRFKEAAKEYAVITGRPRDEAKYVDLGLLIQRGVCQRLREIFIWEDRRFVDFDPFLYYGTNLLIQISAKKLQKAAHDYAKMMQHMEAVGLISISNHYCHIDGKPRFCKSYTIETNLLRSAIDTIDEVELDTIDIPKSEMDELEELAEEAKKTEWVEYHGLKMRFDIDGAMRNVSDDFTRCQKDKYCLSVSKMRCALIAWMDKSRNHEDHIVDFRNFHFLTSMPKAALYHIYDDKGRRFHEIVDLPSGNILTTALSMYNDGSIPIEEYTGILRSIFKKEECGSTYDQFKCDTMSHFSRKFIKKCFQIVINCSDRQLAAHERKARAYRKNPKNIHLQTSKCVVDIQNWLMDKYPNFGCNLRNFDLVGSTHHQGNEVKGTYYAFTYMEKNLIEGIQSKIESNTIRIHDAIWGFEDVCGAKTLLKREVKELSTSNRISFSKGLLNDIVSNKVSKFLVGRVDTGQRRRVMVA